MLIAELRPLDERVLKLDAEIVHRAENDPVARRLMTIPGIGAITATALVALAPLAETFRRGVIRRQVERWFAELFRKQHQRGVHRSTGQLEADILSFIDRHNKSPSPYRRTKSADAIFASIERFCRKTDQTLCNELRFT